VQFWVAAASIALKKSICKQLKVMLSPATLSHMMTRRCIIEIRYCTDGCHSVRETLRQSQTTARCGALRTRFWVPSPAPRLTFASKSSSDLTAADFNSIAVLCIYTLPSVNLQHIIGEGRAAYADTVVWPDTPAQVAHGEDIPLVSHNPYGPASKCYDHADSHPYRPLAVTIRSGLNTRLLNLPSTPPSPLQPCRMLNPPEAD